MTQTKTNNTKAAPPRWDDIDEGDRITVSSKKSDFCGMHGYVTKLRTPRSNKNKIRYSEFHVVLKNGDDFIKTILYENQMIVGWI